MKPYVIAEVGSNWSNIEQLYQSVGQAKETGADAVKYQWLDSAALYNQPHAKVDKYSLNIHNFIMLKKYADLCDIDLIVSCFSVNQLALIDKLVKVHKIASSEMCHIRMLNWFNQCAKPLIISTGGHCCRDIVRTLHCVEKCPVTLLYCEMAYPSKKTWAPAILELKDRFLVPVGFSDHSTEIYSNAMTAVMCGAIMVEKHYNPFDLKGTPDAGHSLNQKDFTLMVGALKSDTKPHRGIDDTHHRCIIATEDIGTGEKFLEGVNIGIYRSLIPSKKKISPFELPYIEGRRSKCVYAKGEPLSSSEST